jgi:hypothetical protein
MADPMTKATRQRVRVNADTTVVVEKRLKLLWYMAPAAPNARLVDRTGATAFLFRCPYTRYTIVAAVADKREVHGFSYVCYHTFPTKDAAIMYALSVGGG